MRDFFTYLELMNHVFDENYRETGTKVLRIPFALEQTFLLQSTYIAPFVSTFVSCMALLIVNKGPLLRQESKG
jgi:hypothetical protein